LLLLTAFFTFSLSPAASSSEKQASLRRARGLVRFKPIMTAIASAAAVSNLVKKPDSSECSVGSGRQTATKSPPGPNLHNGSICPLLLRVVSIRLLASSKYWHPKSSNGKCYYRQSGRNYPNKNRTEIGAFRTFPRPFIFRVCSADNMGLRPE